MIDINIYRDHKGGQDDSENDKMYSINSILGEQRGKHDLVGNICLKVVL